MRIENRDGRRTVAELLLAPIANLAYTRAKIIDEHGRVWLRAKAVGSWYRDGIVGLLVLLLLSSYPWIMNDGTELDWHVLHTTNIAEERSKAWAGYLDP